MLFLLVNDPSYWEAFLKPELLPNWNAMGVLPPIGDAFPMGGANSPFKVSLKNFVLRFGDTPDRKRILQGFLNYRKALHEHGLVEGFHWINGSFSENVEEREGRSPNDIDVVTFSNIEDSQEEQKALLSLGLVSPFSKRFLVDGYFVSLRASPENLVSRSIYWYSLWSHRRDELWKGFVQISLEPTEDEEAAEFLNSPQEDSK
jgi:hypothetical protein